MVARVLTTLLAMLLVTGTAWATLTCRLVPANGGTVRTEDNRVYVTPYNGCLIKSVVWYSADPDGTGSIVPQELYETGGIGGDTYYQAPNSNGYVIVTFVIKSNDVLVSFDLQGIGGPQPPDQNLQIGDTVTRPADPTAEGLVLLEWVTSKTDTIPYDFSTLLDRKLSFDVSDQHYMLKLYAKWVPESALYGSCGKENYLHDGSQVTWALSKSAGSSDYNVLTISGNGEMKDYRDKKLRPYHKYLDQIKTIVIDEGVTHIGKFAFRDFYYVTSNITIPASVESIGNCAFDNIAKKVSNDSLVIRTAEGSHLTDLGDKCFSNARATIDLSMSLNMTAINNEKYFNGIKKDVTLPSSVTSIVKDAIMHFKGNHVYIPLSSSMTLTVNGNLYNGTMTDGKADIITYLFDDLDDRDYSNALTLAIQADPSVKYSITTDSICSAYYRGGYDVINEARPGETVVLSWSGEDVTEGEYVSGFTITKAGGGTVEATPNTDNTDYTFIMPDDDVTITTHTLPQETYTIDLSTDTVQVVPEFLWGMMTALYGYYYCDDDNNMFIDMNRDHKADLRMTSPIDPAEEDEGDEGEEGDDDEEEEEPEEDPYADDYAIRRLPAADQLTTNCLFTFETIEAYRYNRVLVVLDNNFSTQEMPPVPFDILGDINQDTYIDSADVTFLTDILLDKLLWYEYSEDAADVNKDNEISIADLTTLINMLINN